MIQIITCTECGKEKGLPFMIQWRYKSGICKTCSKSLDEYKEYNFCSDKCLKKFVDKFVNHKHKWVVHPYLFSILSQDNKEQQIYKICKICGLYKWFIIKRKDIKDWERTHGNYRRLKKELEAKK